MPTKTIEKTDNSTQSVAAIGGPQVANLNDEFVAWLKARNATLVIFLASEKGSRVVLEDGLKDIYQNWQIAIVPVQNGDV